MGQRSFNEGAVLAFLDEVTMRFGPSRFPTVEIAWDGERFQAGTVHLSAPAEHLIRHPPEEAGSRISSPRGA